MLQSFNQELAVRQDEGIMRAVFPEIFNRGIAVRKKGIKSSHTEVWMNSDGPVEKQKKTCI